MGRDVCEASAAARAVFESADAVLGFPLSRLCFEGPEEELRRTEIQQPALLATSVALLRALEEQAKPSPPSCWATAWASTAPWSPRVPSGSRTASRWCTRGAASCRRPYRQGKGAMAAVLGIDARGGERGLRGGRAAETGGVVAPAN